MTNTNINFIRERNGYSREQVDSYIAKLSSAYQTACDEYLEIKEKYDNLLADQDKFGMQEKPEINSDIIAKTLINAEKLAQQIIYDAREEAEGIVAEAKKAKSDAKAEISKVKEAAQRVVNDAKAEAVKVRDSAQGIINDANAEAVLIVAQARKNLEQARKTMEKASREVDELLTFQILEKASAVSIDE